ncbi:MAG: hypothetical protein ACWGNV_01395 [Bacteroidales bacterium]
MKTKKLNLDTPGWLFIITGAVTLFCCVGCSKVYDGPFFPEESEQSFSGSVGTENVILDGGRATALGGLVTLTFGKVVPPEPYEIFVATFPVIQLDLEDYHTTGRGYFLAFSSDGYAVEVELRYSEEHLKSTMNHFKEEDLAIYRLMIEDPVASAGEKAVPVGQCEVDTENNVVRGSIYGGGTFILVQE